MASYYAIVVLSILAFSTAGHALDCKKEQTTLYIKQTPSQDQRSVGTDTVVINWPIKDGPDSATAKTIGYAEDLAIHANLAKNLWVTIMDMVFGDGSLTGSTLKMMGLHGLMRDGAGQWSVMGGTGELTMARGVINYRVIQEDLTSRTFEIRIVVYYTPEVDILAPGGTANCY